MMYYTYILECSDGTLYTGYTSDLTRRLEEHNSGVGAKYTRSRRPCKIVFYQAHEERAEAMRMESSIKLMDRKSKLKFIEESRAKNASRT